MAAPVAVHVFCAAYIPYASRGTSRALSGGGHAGGGGFGGVGGGGGGGGGGGHSNGTWWQAELGTFRHYDTADPHLTDHLPYTDETQCKLKWLRGPFSPVQGNLDHLFTYTRAAAL